MNVKRLVDDLIRHEGLRLTVYDDATGKPIGQGDTLQGHPTIGIGRNLAGKGITEKEAKELLYNDIEYFYKKLRKIHTFNTLDELRQRVILNMAFNMGVERLKRFKRMWAALGRSDYNEAAFEMLDSKWHRDFITFAKNAGLDEHATRSWELAQKMRSGKE